MYSPILSTILCVYVLYVGGYVRVCVCERGNRSQRLMVGIFHIPPYFWGMITLTELGAHCFG